MLIAALCLVDLVTYFAGLIIIVPWLAYANWHACRTPPLRCG